MTCLTLESLANLYDVWTQIIDFTESRVRSPTFLLPPLSFALNAASFFPPTHLPSGHRFAISGHLTTHCTLLSASAPSSASSLLAFTRRVERRDSQNIPSFSPGCHNLSRIYIELPMETSRVLQVLQEIYLNYHGEANTYLGG